MKLAEEVEVRAVVRRIIKHGRYEDDKVVVRAADSDGATSLLVYLKMTDPPMLVYRGYEWGGSWEASTFHAGRWCEHLAAAAERIEARAAELHAETERQMAEARLLSYTPVNDAEFFNGTGTTGDAGADAGVEAGGGPADVCAVRPADVPAD
jgi:hypothetical protein